MSGGVGPTCNDISLPRGLEHEPKESNDPSLKSDQKLDCFNHATTQCLLPSFPLLSALAVIMVFSTSGMVSLEDFAFVLFSLI
ncbi:Transmembrane protein [Quillaja saponaria]|uniref:Transmembrane protein n=1 Tax=Quillaja saponaria TaxID=32244 RepID=A0AAD7M4N9_QUISA|nr:Transmembrane protein [Quillaja saponaria]